ncbi:calcium/sodium antiporter [Sulfurimonas diazotrophicus]|uniref:Calcium/sodium antiporter n=1 Tax=Sulfurimonas diazotrophicus TaxID=3131939 RepID=A0ABZ3HDV1_9BACT
MEYLVFVAAMAALIWGADFIIRESERIALHYNISHFVIGATLVGFGTSLPEMAASMTASWYAKPEMAVANVVGSVTMNITLVLGLVFVLAKKMNPNRDLFNRDSAWILFPVILYFLTAYDGVIGRFEGSIFVMLMAAYLYFLFSTDGSELTEEIDESLEKESFAWGKTIALLLVGFVMTIGGAHFVVESASMIARSLGVSEWVIGLLLIAFGTSLPELVVSLVALKKGNADLSIGNIIGSNVANFAMVLGGAAIIRPLPINGTNLADIYIMMAASLALLLVLANKLYSKAGGIILLMIFALFVKSALGQ